MARAARRRLPAWLPVAGAAIGVTVLAARLATLPFADAGPFLVGLLLAVAVTVVLLVGRVVARRRGMRAALAAYPHSLLIPIAVGADTAAATRWLAERLGDPGLRLRPDRPAIVVVDSTGLRILGDGPASRAVAPGMLSILPLATARLGARRVDALVLGVVAGDAVAPLPLVPARSSALALGALSDAELLDVSARIRAALAGGPETARWDY